MIKKNLIFVLIVLFLSSCLSTSDQIGFTSDQLSLKEHADYAEKFTKKENLSYTLKVSYNLFSPLRGHWYIEVHNGTLIAWQRDKVWNDPQDKGSASLFLIENLFRLGAKAYDVETHYITKSYYDESGMIKEIRRFANPDTNGPVPMDKAYSIRVLELEWLDGENK